MHNAAAKLIFPALLTACILASAMAQPARGLRGAPVAKLFVAESRGEAVITTHEQVQELRQATSFDAPGAVIETKPDSHNAVVYSNGTGMFVDGDTRVEIQRFSQEPFVPSQYSMDVEPSITHSSVFISRGFVGICTNRMVSGSSMTYATPHAAVTIRGRRLAIETTSEETIIYLLEGDITVRSDPRDFNGHVLRPGEQAFVRPGPTGQPPSVTISPIPSALMARLDERVNVACNARRTVSFESIDRPAGDDAAGDGSADEIIARPTVPAEVPPHLTVSPDRLPGT